MSTPQTRRWSPERRRPEPTHRGLRAASVVLLVLVVVLLGVVAREAVTSGLLDFGAVGGWR